MATKKQINALERACTAYEEKNDADASGFEWYTNTETDSSVTWKFKDFPAIVTLVYSNKTNRVTTTVS